MLGEGILRKMRKPPEMGTSTAQIRRFPPVRRSKPEKRPEIPGRTIEGVNELREIMGLGPIRPVPTISKEEQQMRQNLLAKQKEETLRVARTKGGGICPLCGQKLGPSTIRRYPVMKG